MRELLNVLYVLTQGAYLHLDHDTVRIVLDDETSTRLPLLRLCGIVVFGQVSMSPFLIHRCAEDGRSVVWLDRQGRFKGRVEGRLRGNVLLRRAQHLALSDRDRVSLIARQLVAAKVQNSRVSLLRSAREADEDRGRNNLVEAAERLSGVLKRLRQSNDLNEIRGLEGEAARAYFQVFGEMVRADRDAFSPDGRTRRPPRDRMNAALSFLYAVLRTECMAALEATGLDPQVGFLHALRPGRPALALDLMEELRPLLADRLALTLINRRQLTADHFEMLPGGAVALTEEGRRTLIVAYQRRKEEEIQHRVVRQKVPLGLVPHVQARLLARHLRGELKDYPPFVHR